jgi:hypothetical protein
VKDCYLIQHCAPPSPLLEIAATRHAPYCAEHDIEYLISDRRWCKWPAQWDKLFFLADVANDAPEGALLVYADHDALIVGDEDLRCAPLGRALFGGVRNLWGDFNLGVMFVRNSAPMRALLKALTEHPIIGQALNEHRPFNVALREFRIESAALPRRWNDYRQAEVLSDGRPTVIRAWHNEPKAFAEQAMRRELLLCCG